MEPLNYADLRVLVIDDFDSFRLTVSKMLDEFGCGHIDTAVNGRRALKICEENEFDVVLCDYNLGPGPNGQQVLETLRERNLLRRQSLFMLVSAESSKSIVLSAYDYHPDTYLTKPITGRGLKQRLDRLLRQRQEMMSVYQALEHDDVDQAIALSLECIANGSRATTALQKLLGDVYLETGRLDEAEQLFTKVLEIRPLDWARVGMSKVKSARGDLDTSNDWLSQIIDSNPFCMQAYDQLADNYREQDNMERVQDVLQAAVDVSPMSMVRQASLAQVASENNDYIVASKAYSRTVRLGQHSCHDRLEHHLQFGRVTSSMIREDPTINSDVAREGLKVLDALPKRFQLDSEARYQSQLLESQLHACRGDTRRANETLAEVEELMQGKKLSLALQLDRVATYQNLNQDLKCGDLLEALVAEYQDDEQALQRIDLWLEEPISEFNTKLVARINNEGITSYQNKEFDDALNSFRRAARLFPNHLGVHLNLVQALVADMKERGVNETNMDTCLSSLHKVERKIKAGHPQLERFRQLQHMVRSLG
ncbi:MAG: response regulator [Cellvibrionaceae bacterium]|nr:response regulator [Cellvibrionaceae bacterium]|tara:strand:- start:35266 stop:36882 length:1617 start_codon:yes stop_codon:yes gene_type:complete